MKNLVVTGDGYRWDGPLENGRKVRIEVAYGRSVRDRMGAVKVHFCEVHPYTAADVVYEQIALSTMKSGNLMWLARRNPKAVTRVAEFVDAHVLHLAEEFSRGGNFVYQLIAQLRDELGGYPAREVTQPIEEVRADGI